MIVMARLAILGDDPPPVFGLLGVLGLIRHDRHLN
jgi:hypothetical protein